VCGRRHCAFGSVATDQYFFRQARACVALADCDQEPCNVANHVLQKRVCCYIDRYPVFIPGDPQFVYVSYGCRGPAASCPKRREIVFAKQIGCGFLHILFVERLMHPPGPVPIHGRAKKPVQYQVTIGSRSCRKACVKLVVDLLGPAHIYIVRKIAVCTEQPGTVRPICPSVEVNDLTKSVHAGIGSSGTCCLDQPVCHLRQCVFDKGLDADTITLALPAVVSCAVVLDTECNTKSFIPGAYAYPGSDSSSCCACCFWPSSPSSSTSSRMLRAPPGSPMST